MYFKELFVSIGTIKNVGYFEVEISLVLYEDVRRMKPRKYPVKITLDEDLVKRLEECASRYGRRSMGTVAAEVVTDYIDFWEEVERERQRIKERQREAVSGKVRKRA